MRAILFSIILLFTCSADERIVSLSPSITEIIFALGKGDEVVATSEYSLYPKEAARLPTIGSYSNPNIEKIISFKPTLVVGQEFNKKTLKESQKFHIKTLELNLQNIQNIKDSIIKLSKTLHPEGTSHTKHNAAKLVDEIDSALNSSKNKQKPHSVLIVYGLKEDLRSGIYVAGQDIFFNDIIKACGHTNAYRDTLIVQPVLGYENIIALNPEQIIILHSRASAPHVDIEHALKSWKSIPTRASKNSHISIVDEDYIHIPSHRVAKSIQRLCKEMDYD